MKKKSTKMNIKQGQTYRPRDEANSPCSPRNASRNFDFAAQRTARFARVNKVYINTYIDLASERRVYTAHDVE